MDAERNPVVKDLLEALPPLIARHRIPELLPGVISRGYLQNLDSKGAGPRRFLVGRRVCYRKIDFVQWLEDRGIVEGKGAGQRAVGK